MEFSFVHIGMMKTASTYMQDVWLRDELYSLSHKTTLDFVNQMKSMVKNKDFNKELSLDINSDKKYKEGQGLVISNEGLSTAYLNEPAHQDKIVDFIDYSSHVFGQLGAKTPNLLIVVREPLSWLKSMFIQSIKQGGSGCAQNFINEQHDLLKHSFNLELILDCYKRYFNNILVLPFEILKEDENEFWNIISEELNVPFARTRLQRVNKSFGLKRTFILAKMNEMSGFLLNTLETSKEYYQKYKPERDKLLGLKAELRKWLPRRFVRFATEEELNEMYNLFNISVPQEDFFDFTITDELVEIIKSKYLKTLLENNVDLKYINLYKNKLQDHVAKKKLT